ncbi:MAG: type II toxin-antitoxin system VapC family toxin [Promethearchaeota archaeon]
MIFIDSDLAISFLSKKEKPLNLRAKEIMEDLFKSKETLCLTIFNYAELLRGAYISSNVAYNTRIIEHFKRHFNIIGFTGKAVDLYAKIYAELKQKGEIIGDMDELIASIVIANDGHLYTKNLDHFNRISLLKIIDWSNVK